MSDRIEELKDIDDKTITRWRDLMRNKEIPPIDKLASLACQILAIVFDYELARRQSKEKGKS